MNKIVKQYLEDGEENRKSSRNWMSDCKPRKVEVGQEEPGRTEGGLRRAEETEGRRGRLVGLVDNPESRNMLRNEHLGISIIDSGNSVRIGRSCLPFLGVEPP
jgi:hypothetical protein